MSLTRRAALGGLAASAALPVGAIAAPEPASQWPTLTARGLWSDGPIKELLLLGKTELGKSVEASFTFANGVSFGDEILCLVRGNPVAYTLTAAAVNGVGKNFVYPVRVDVGGAIFLSNNRLLVI